MPRTKERPKFIHEATTSEYLYCLGSMPKWSQVLFDHSNGKPYNDFLKWIIQLQYFKDDQKVSVKKLADLSGYTSAKISKWLREISEDILALNEAQPSLFYFHGNIEVQLYFHYYDSYCSFKTSIPAIPRKYETFEFYFIKAKLGVHFFWVEEVRHIIEENKTYITISLQGGIVNIYRELALSKALFEGTVSSLDVYKKYDFEIDKLLGKTNLF
jgi:hypothetical protein